MEGSFVDSGSFNTSESSWTSSLLAVAHDDAALLSFFIPATASNQQRFGRNALDRLLARMMMMAQKTRERCCLIGPRKNDLTSASQDSQLEWVGRRAAPEHGGGVSWSQGVPSYCWECHIR